MLGERLGGREVGIRKETTRQTGKDLARDESRPGVGGRTSAIVHEESVSEKPETNAAYDEGLETTDLFDHLAERHAPDDGAEAIHGSDARGISDAEIERNEEHRIQEIGLFVPRNVIKTATPRAAQMPRSRKRYVGIMGCAALRSQRAKRGTVRKPRT